tara:strand:+ start:1725 stop:2549 length:825 start_codon:yes stop_codon:yes gene_type:complete
MRKILLVSGCSMADKNFRSATNPGIDTSWPKWPELLAKKLDMDCINLGSSGAGNEYIYSSLLEQILQKKDQIGLVISSWSQCQREDYQEWNRWKHTRVYTNGDVFGWLKKSLVYMISLQAVCERYNIPLKQIQMIPLYYSWLCGLGKTDEEIFRNRDKPDFKFKYTYPGDKEKDKKKCEKIIMTYEPYINVENFIGWPTVKNLGGYNIEEKTIKSQEQKGEKDNRTKKQKVMMMDYLENRGYEFEKDLIVSEWDQHPNAKGNEKIMEFIYDRLG